MTRDDALIGTWTLVATAWRREDGREANPFGDAPCGILTYDAGGLMAAQIMRADRPPTPAADPAGIEAAMASAFPGYVAYFGAWHVDDAGVLQHEVTGSAFPAWVGTTHARRYRIEGDTLTLMQDFTTGDGVAVAASTTWRRVASPDASATSSKR